MKKFRNVLRCFRWGFQLVRSRVQARSFVSGSEATDHCKRYIQGLQQTAVQERGNEPRPLDIDTEYDSSVRCFNFSCYT